MQHLPNACKALGCEGRVVPAHWEQGQSGFGSPGAAAKPPEWVDARCDTCDTAYRRRLAVDFMTLANRYGVTEAELRVNFPRLPSGGLDPTRYFGPITTAIAAKLRDLLVPEGFDLSAPIEAQKPSNSDTYTFVQ